VSNAPAARWARPRVLFVGREASSPEIAASLLRAAVGDQVEVDTADTEGIDPTGRSSEMLVAMGLDPAEEHRLGARALYRADRVVILDPALDVARLPGPRYEEWDLTRGDLGTRVRRLGDELTAGPAPTPRLTVLTRLRGLLDAVRHR
jgi:hypothetical protein